VVSPSSILPEGSTPQAQETRNAGFYVLSDWAEIIYKATDYYAPQWERALLWNDPDVGIEWPIIEGLPLLISEKDQRGAK
jgi:dTDP-4-dehydrorhamnose 3,5-epimerase-like enzyme